MESLFELTLVTLEVTHHFKQKQFVYKQCVSIMSLRFGYLFIAFPLSDRLLDIRRRVNGGSGISINDKGMQ